MKYSNIIAFILGLIVCSALVTKQKVYVAQDPITDTIRIKYDSIQYRDSIIYKWRKAEPIYLHSVDTMRLCLSGKDSIDIANEIYKDLLEYYSTNKYRDTLINNEQLFATISEDVSTNKIYNRRFTYFVKPIDVIDYKALYIDATTRGVGIRFDNNNTFDYLLGYNFNNSIYFGVSYRIFQY